MLAATVDDLRNRAESLKAEIASSNEVTIEIGSDVSPVGGGSLPGAELPTMILQVNHSKLSADELARRFRLGSIRIFPRIQQNRVIIDLRSVLPEDDSKVALAIRLAAEQGST